MKIFSNIANLKLSEDLIFLHYTGSMFGIGCSAFKKKTIEKINLLKVRKDKSGFIVLIPHINWLKRYNVNISIEVKHLLQQYWPGELSVILETADPKFQHVSQNGKVAFRIPADKLLRDFIIELDQPIVSTSVNKTGEQPLLNLDKIISNYESWFDLAILPDKLTTSINSPSTIIEFFDSKLKLIREGSVPFSEIELSFDLPQILFVCTGNTCRSPIAEYLAKNIIERDNLKLRAVSAGFLEGGEPISENSKQVLALNDIDDSGHVSTLLGDELFRKSWLILTMTEEHKKKILQLNPAAISKTHTLSEFAGFGNDIADPYGKELENYKKTFIEINKKLKIIFERIREER